MFFLFLRIRRPPIHTRSATLVPFPTFFRSLDRLPLCTLVCVQSGLGGHVHTVGADRQHAKPRAILTTPESATIVRAMCLIALALDAHPRYSLVRSEEHTSELQSLMRISYAVFCLIKNIKSLPNIQLDY